MLIKSVVAAVTALVLIGTPTASADAGRRWQPPGSNRAIAVLPDGEPSAKSSYRPVVSPNGRYLVFQSADARLDPDHPTARGQHLYVRDRKQKTTTMVDVTPDGRPASDPSEDATWASDVTDRGLVLFTSEAADLVPGDTNQARDVFVRDARAGKTTIVSVDAAGEPSDQGSGGGAITPDGVLVVFGSAASDLVEGDANGTTDVFLRDLRHGTTTLVSHTPAGSAGNGESSDGEISDDGRLITFNTAATDIVDGGGTSRDVVLHDRTTGETWLVSRSSDGSAPDGESRDARISGDGSTVVFRSEATNLVEDDPTGFADLFAYDVADDMITPVTVPLGSQGAKDSNAPEVSADGRIVVFYSEAANLVAGDTNRAFDVFRSDLASQTTTIVSLTQRGEPSVGGGSYSPDVSADGHTVTYHTNASNLLKDERDGWTSIVHRVRGS